MATLSSLQAHRHSLLRCGPPVPYIPVCRPIRNERIPSQVRSNANKLYRTASAVPVGSCTRDLKCKRACRIPKPTACTADLLLQRRDRRDRNSNPWGVGRHRCMEVAAASWLCCATTVFEQGSTAHGRCPRLCLALASCVFTLASSAWTLASCCSSRLGAVGASSTCRNLMMHQNTTLCLDISFTSAFCQHGRQHGSSQSAHVPKCRCAGSLSSRGTEHTHMLDPLTSAAAHERTC